MDHPTRAAVQWRCVVLPSWRYPLCTVGRELGESPRCSVSSDTTAAESVGRDSDDLVSGFCAVMFSRG